MIAEYIYLEKYNSYYEDEDPMFDIDEYESMLLGEVETDDES
jgi:hypothetical protein